ncbi:ribosome-inactivating protein [Tanacetum coccineum]
MRLFLATFFVLLAAIYLHLGGVEELRSRLASGTDVHGIAVTRPPTNITFQERFIQVQLENGGGDVITAFPNIAYTHRAIGFDGSYSTLGNRQETELGHGALNNAITNLFNERSTSNSKKRALLVIIQMVAEAVRIRYIEHLIRRNMLGENPNFILDPRVISMENRWSDPSEQIQWSGESGIFLREIQVQSVSNEVVRIRNVQDTWSLAALALILYKCNPKAIRMPVPVVVGADEQCPDGEPTTNIIGRDGQCMDVKDEQYNNGNPIILWACGNAKAWIASSSLNAKAGEIAVDFHG